jgi:hypothetical protein
MTLPRLLTAVPVTWSVRLEIAKAIADLAKQLETEKKRARIVESATNPGRDAVAEAFHEFYRDLRKANFNPDEPRVPAGNPDGGQWTTEGAYGASSDRSVISDAAPDNTWIPGARYAANNPSDAGNSQQPPEILQEEPKTRQAINTFLKAAAYFLAGAIAAGEPVGDVILALEAIDWLSQYLPWIYSYLDAPKSLEQLQQAAQNPQAGYNIHHIVEQTPALQDGFSQSVVNSPENLVLVPTFTHWLITAWFATQNDEYGSLSPREYLRGKSWEERMRVGKQALIDFGVLAP